MNRNNASVQNALAHNGKAYLECGGSKAIVQIDTITDTLDETRFEGHFIDIPEPYFYKTSLWDDPKKMYMASARHQGKTLSNAAFLDYLHADVENTRKLKERMSMTIKDVIFNDPATIVFWMDGSKTVVKCQPGDIYDPEKGLAMAISKKALGNQGNYCEVFKKWLPEEKGTSTKIIIGKVVDFEERDGGFFARFGLNNMIEAKKLNEAMEKMINSLSFQVDRDV